MKILTINGSYRENGFTDQALSLLASDIRQSGAEVDEIRLRDCDIHFCTNCRQCTQHEGDAPGLCVQNDEMRSVIEKIEQADAYILAAPTNFGSVTAAFKQFMERLVVYAWWPWGAAAPKYRKAGGRKKALLISSSAAPGLMARVAFSTMRQLKATAKVIGAKPVGSLASGLVAGTPAATLKARDQKRLHALAARLLP